MPAWAWVLSVPLALMSLTALALFLFRIHYFLEWRGIWSGTLSGSSGGSLRVETRFLWFKHTWEPLKDKSWSVADLFTDDNDNAVKDQAPDVPDSPDAPETAKSGSGFSELEHETEFSEPAAETVTVRSTPLEEPVFLKGPNANTSSTRTREIPETRFTETRIENGKKKSRKPADPYRKQRALFRLITDPDAWKLLGKYGLKVAKMLARLLKPKIEAAVGHPDPAFLGRVAGKWYAARPFTQIFPVGRPELYFRFQDRSPSLWVRVQGSFSGLSVLAFGVRLLIAFPSIRLARRAIHGWRRHQLTGWRAWVYRKLQAD